MKPSFTVTPNTRQRSATAVDASPSSFRAPSPARLRSVMPAPDAAQDSRTFADGLNAALDRAVRRAHQLRLFGRPCHPYFLVCDASIVLVLGLALVFSACVEGFDLPAFGFSFLFVQILYQGLYMATKQQLTGRRPEPRFAEVCFVVLPGWLLSAWLADIPLGAAADFGALSMVLVLAMRRLASFFGGSYRGKPARCGVAYDAALLRPVHGWRDYEPGPAPLARVLPLSLISSGVCFALFGALTLRMLEVGHPDGWALPRLMLSYALYRFVEEFYREDQGASEGEGAGEDRPALTPPQWTCLLLGALGLAALLFS